MYIYGISHYKLNTNEKSQYLLPLDMLYHWEQTRPESVFLSQPINKVYHHYTWVQVANEARKMAAYLISLRLPSNSNIGIYSKNCAHWIISDFAIMMAGHVSVPIYPNLTKNTVKELIELADIQVLFVGILDGGNFEKFDLYSNLTCVSLPFCEHKDLLKWYDLLEQHAPLQGKTSRLSEEIMTIIFTSGTSGNAKGVMLSFGAIAFASTEGAIYFKTEIGERTLSYLTLAHAGERSFIELGGLYSCSHIHFLENTKALINSMKEVEPTYFLAVPQVWKKMQEGVLAKISQTKLSLLLKVPFLSAIVKRKILSQLGLNKVKVAITGASALSPKTKKWFRDLGINLMEVYSMTENFAYSHVNSFEKQKYNSVGKALYKNEVKLDGKNEILVKSPALFTGYFKVNKDSKAYFDKDGFFRTGDQGKIDEDNYLFLTGRCRDNFKTSKGKYVAPAPIEQMLTAHPNIELACVMGNSMEKPYALICLSETGKKLDTLKINGFLKEFKAELNKKLEKNERLKEIIIAKEEWTIENGYITPTLKIKRTEIEKRYNLIPDCS